MTDKKLPTGNIISIIGVVVDVHFEGHIPETYSALLTRIPNGSKLTLEVQSHIGSGKVRTIAMSTTDGLKIGQEVTDTLAPISVPVGKETLGRVFDVTGNIIDEGKNLPENTKR